MKYLKNFNTLQEYGDTLILDVPNTSYIVEDGEVKYSEEPKVGSKYIIYKSNDGQIITPYKTDGFGASLISNKYNDFGLISFDDAVTSVGNNAFAYRKLLTSITIPNSITSIGNGAFTECSALTSITIPNSVTSIGQNAFWGCSSLTSINIGNGVTSIGDWTFAYCSSLTSVTIPNSVTIIGDYAFSSCSKLTSITCEATTPPTLGSNNNLSNVTAVYVPADSVDDYRIATNWAYYADKIKPIQ